MLNTPPGFLFRYNGSFPQPLGWFFGIYATDYLRKSAFSRPKVFGAQKNHFEGPKWEFFGFF